MCHKCTLSHRKEHEELTQVICQHYLVINIHVINIFCITMYNTKQSCAFGAVREHTLLIHPT